MRAIALGGRIVGRSAPRTCLAGTSAAGCATVHQGVEARAGEAAEEQEDLSGSHRLTGSRMGITMLMNICLLLVSKARGSRC
jgi:hypothetical protein